MIGLVKKALNVGKAVLGLGAAGHVATLTPGFSVDANTVAAIQAASEFAVAVGAIITGLAMLIEKLAAFRK